MKPKPDGGSRPGGHEGPLPPERDKDDGGSCDGARPWGDQPQPRLQQHDDHFCALRHRWLPGLWYYGTLVLHNTGVVNVLMYYYYKVALLIVPYIILVLLYS